MQAKRMCLIKLEKTHQMTIPNVIEDGKNWHSFTVLMVIQFAITHLDPNLATLSHLIFFFFF
jgi:hypothetical protein